MQEAGSYEKYSKFDMADDDEEETDVEQVISGVEDDCAAFMNPMTRASFERIFDAARKTYADSNVQEDWNELFESLSSELTGASDEDDMESILDSYVRKAEALT